MSGKCPEYIKYPRDNPARKIVGLLAVNPKFSGYFLIIIPTPIHVVY
jgi:hypothetical protein